jgi:type II secretory pathway pseudopilin PulG
MAARSGAGDVRARHRAAGFTYLGVLLAIALIGVGLTAASELWSTAAKRQRLEQLDWIGQQYVAAIGSYYQSSPRGVKEFPKSLDELVLDRRVPFVRRHLRQLYPNPFTGQLDWEPIEARGLGIRGVRARGTGAGDNLKVVGDREYVYLPTVAATTR